MQLYLVEFALKKVLILLFELANEFKLGVKGRLRRHPLFGVSDSINEIKLDQLILGRLSVHEVGFLRPYRVAALIVLAQIWQFYVSLQRALN